jgi:ribonuclease E
VRVRAAVELAAAAPIAAPPVAADATAAIRSARGVADEAVATAAAAPAEAPAPAVPPAPVTTAAAPAPAAAAPAPMPAAEPIDASALQSVVAQAGLQWVQTAPAAIEAEPEPIAPVQRAPRVRKPRAPVASEPLVQVETQEPRGEG